MNATDISAPRAVRNSIIAATVARIRDIERQQGVTRAALGAIGEELSRLAAETHLFPTAEFAPPPPGEKGARRYRLHADADDRFALYLNVLNPGNETRPHDHTTWAVVVAVEGQELNRVYRRTDDGLTPGRASLALDHEVMVEPGTGIALMPEDIHSIHTLGDRPTRHLHMYGLALERLDDRVGYDLEQGSVQPYNRAFMKPSASPR